MEVPITKFRSELFDLMNRAMQGESISVTYKGERFRIVPEMPPQTRFDRITPLQVVNPDYPGDHEAAKRQLMEEMTREWEEDWSSL